VRVIDTLYRPIRQSHSWTYVSSQMGRCWLLEYLVLRKNLPIDGPIGLDRCVGAGLLSAVPIPLSCRSKKGDRFWESLETVLFGSATEDPREGRERMSLTACDIVTLPSFLHLIISIGTCQMPYRIWKRGLVVTLGLLFLAVVLPT
jgi:hypothetical protein